VLLVVAPRTRKHKLYVTRQILYHSCKGKINRTSILEHTAYYIVNFELPRKKKQNFEWNRVLAELRTLTKVYKFVTISEFLMRLCKEFHFNKMFLSKHPD